MSDIIKVSNKYNVRSSRIEATARIDEVKLKGQYYL